MAKSFTFGNNPTMFMNSDSLCGKIKKSAQATQDNVGRDRRHDDYSKEFERQLNHHGVAYQPQLPIQDLYGRVIGVPDFTVFERNVSVCHIEVKAKLSGLDTADIEQAKKYKAASGHAFVYLINFGKIDGPNIRKM